MSREYLITFYSLWTDAPTISGGQHTEEQKIGLNFGWLYLGRFSPRSFSCWSQRFYNQMAVPSVFHPFHLFFNWGSLVIKAPHKFYMRKLSHSAIEIISLMRSQTYDNLLGLTGKVPCKALMTVDSSKTGKHKRTQSENIKNNITFSWMRPSKSR